VHNLEYVKSRPGQFFEIRINWSMIHSVFSLTILFPCKQLF